MSKIMNKVELLPNFDNLTFAINLITSRVVDNIVEWDKSD